MFRPDKYNFACDKMVIIKFSPKRGRIFAYDFCFGEDITHVYDYMEEFLQDIRAFKKRGYEIFYIVDESI